MLDYQIWRLIIEMKRNIYLLVQILQQDFENQSMKKG